MKKLLRCFELFLLVIFHNSADVIDVAAHVEIDKPHYMMEAMKTIIKADPDAYVGSRILLSLVKGPVPECADLTDLAWLYDIGYKKMMLCDELCLKENLLARAVNVFECFRQAYAKDRPEKTVRMWDKVLSFAKRCE